MYLIGERELIGDGTAVIEKPINNYGIFVNQGADGFCMMNITIKERDDSVGDGEICLFPCLEVLASKTRIEFCKFESIKMTSDMKKKKLEEPMTVYYTSKHDSKNVVEKFHSDCVELCTQNTFANNTVISPHKHDNFSFSLQKNGSVFRNKINGMLAVFMCKDTVVKENHITCTNQHALFLSLPSKGIKIGNNNLESTGEHSTLMIKQQGDNPNPDKFLDNNYSNIGTEISENHFKRKRWAIEISHQVPNSDDEGGTVERTRSAITGLSISNNLFNAQHSDYNDRKWISNDEGITETGNRMNDSHEFFSSRFKSNHSP